MQQKKRPQTFRSEGRGSELIQTSLLQLSLFVQAFHSIDYEPIVISSNRFAAEFYPQLDSFYMHSENEASSEKTK